MLVADSGVGREGQGVKDRSVRVDHVQRGAARRVGPRRHEVALEGDQLPVRGPGRLAVGSRADGLIAIAEADAGTTSSQSAFQLVFEQIGYGLVGGLVAGALGAIALRQAARRRRLSGQRPSRESR